MANSDTTINTGGGASTGNVQTGRDFVGRDQINFIVPLGNWEEVRRLLFKDLARPVTKSIQEQFQSFDWAKAEQAYLDKVVKLYDRVRILGNSTDVPLGDIFTQVYILDKPTARYRHDIDELRKRSGERNEFQRQPGKRMHGLDLVQQGQNLFILGKPGAGKTTFLKYITVQAARKQLPRIPIFLSLNQWADSRWDKGDKAALLPFLIEQFDICDFPDAALFIDYLLREGRALVMFDGLDEVKQEKDQRRRLTHLLQDFTRKYDKSQHLITCRIAASDYAFAGFADVEVADFTPEQVREYARKWFGEQATKVDAFTAELEKPENEGLAELCNTPLLLSMLCLTFDNNLHFPPSRAELYEDALETLLRKWDSSRQIQRDEVYRTLSHKRKLQLLMSIAVPTFEKGELFFRQRDLEQWIVDYLAKLPGALSADTLDGAVILKAMEAQHSVLVERAQGIYSFSHLTFQEYLTARYLAENQGNEVAHRLLYNHLTDLRWREVFLLTANLLNDADAYVTAMRRAIDGVIADAPTVLQLLTWVHGRTQEVNVSVELRHAVQETYISLAFLPQGAIERAREQLQLRYRLPECVHTSVEFALAWETQFPHNIRETLDSAQWRIAQWKTLDSAHTTTPLIDFDYGLFYIWVHATLFAYKTSRFHENDLLQYPGLVESVAALGINAGLVDLAEQLIVQSIPLPSASEQDWQQYADALFAILQDKRELPSELVFSDKENTKLNDYFYANELLVQCLKGAVVSNRQAILNELLSPHARVARDRTR